MDQTLSQNQIELEAYLEMPNQTCEIIRRIEYLQYEIGAQEEQS